MELDSRVITVLREWAHSRPSVLRLWVFGSYAAGTARADSDLDLAFTFDAVDNELAELIELAASDKEALARITGMTVKDMHLETDAPVQNSARLLIYEKPSAS